MKLIVKVKELRYGGKQMYAGDDFEATDRDGKWLKAIGKASDAPGKTAAAKPVAAPLQTADLAVEVKPEDDEPKRRTYRRRDITAEE